MEITEYLKIVVDMEKNILLQKNIISELETKINGLAIPKNIKFKFSEPNIKDFRIPILIKLFFAILIFLTYKVMDFLDFFTRHGHDNILFNEGLGALLDYWGLPGLLFFGFFSFIFISLSYVLVDFIFDNGKRSYQEKYSNYLLEKEKYEGLIEEENLRISEEEKIKQVYLNELSKIEKQHYSSQSHLHEIYNKNIIFPKYRNLVMISSLYEYVDSGRCTTLEGHEGAYNILELEIRLDRIVTQLDKIISQLEQIKANQFMLYSCMIENNNKLSELINLTNSAISEAQKTNNNLVDQNKHLEKINHSSAISLYNLERTKIEMEYMNKMNYLAGNYDKRL